MGLRQNGRGALFARMVWVLALFLIPAPANAEKNSSPRWLFFSGASVAQDNSFFYSGGRYYASGDTNAGGWILEASAGTGRYSYLTANVPGGVVDATFNLTEAAIGYGYRWDRGRIIGFIGVRHEQHDLTPFDPGNRNQGSQTGISGKIDLWVKPADNILVTFYASATSVFSGYYATGFAGYRPVPGVDLFVGPEIGLAGNSSYSQTQIGVRATGIPLFGFSIAVSGGVSEDSDTGTSPYGSLSAWFSL